MRQNLSQNTRNIWKRRYRFLYYLAPEFLLIGHCSAKSDIYSFGVVLLETLTCQRASKIDFGLVGLENPLIDSDLDEWESPFLEFVEGATPVLVDRNKLKKIIDPRLGPNYPLEGAFEYASLALRCVAKDGKDRPSTQEVLESLERIYAVHK